jgi:hypothetical protein
MGRNYTNTTNTTIPEEDFNGENDIIWSGVFTRPMLLAGTVGLYKIADSRIMGAHRISNWFGRVWRAGGEDLRQLREWEAQQEAELSDSSTSSDSDMEMDNIV